MAGVVSHRRTAVLEENGAGEGPRETASPGRPCFGGCLDLVRVGVAAEQGQRAEGGDADWVKGEEPVNDLGGELRFTEGSLGRRKTRLPASGEVMYRSRWGCTESSLDWLAGARKPQLARRRMSSRAVVRVTRIT